MISNNAWRTTLEEIKKIAGLELTLYYPDGTAAASTAPPGPEKKRNENREKAESVPPGTKQETEGDPAGREDADAAGPGTDGRRAAEFAASEADLQSFGGTYFVRVTDRGRTAFILSGRGGGDTLTCLRLAALQLGGMIGFQRERSDRDAFIKNVVLGNLLPVDVEDRARRFCMDTGVKRAVFLIETRENGSDAVLEILRPLYGEMAGGFLFKAEQGRCVYVRTLRGGEGARELEEIGKNIVDVINTEGMQDAWLSFGGPAEELKELPVSYGEACLAMRIGRIFFRENHVTAYDRLGIGRLIYSLPMPLCRKFLSEVFAQAGPKELDEEALMTIRQLFDDSLNIAETARHLYIHRNTLVYRLDKLQKQLGLNIRNFDDAVTLKLGLMVYEYVNERMKEE